MRDKKRHIPWFVTISEEIATEYVGVKLGEYYRDPKIMLQTQLKAGEMFHNLYGLPKAGVKPTYSSYVEATQLGVEIFFPDDNVPMVRRPVLNKAEDVYKLKILNPYKEGLMAQMIRTYEYMKKHTPDGVPVGLGGTEGPITTAVIVRGQDFFVDLFLHPKEIHKLLEMVVEVSLLIRRAIEKVTGEKIRSTNISDDFSGLLSPEQYKEFAYPYQKQIYDEFGHQGRSLHSELLKREHLKFLLMLGVTHYDPGCDQYLEVRDIIEQIPQIPFSFNLKTSQDMIQGTPKGIRERYVQCVEDGAPEMCAEICRGTPKENIRAFVEVAKEYE
jgi:uroporphyrinogen-III decarboxylase